MERGDESWPQPRIAGNVPLQDRSSSVEAMVAYPRLGLSDSSESHHSSAASGPTSSIVSISSSSASSPVRYTHMVRSNGIVPIDLGDESSSSGSGYSAPSTTDDDEGSHREASEAVAGGDDNADGEMPESVSDSVIGMTHQQYAHTKAWISGQGNGLEEPATPQGDTADKLKQSVEKLEQSIEELKETIIEVKQQNEDNLSSQSPPRDTSPSSSPKCRCSRGKQKFPHPSTPRFNNKKKRLSIQARRASWLRSRKPAAAAPYTRRPYRPKKAKRAPSPTSNQSPNIPIYKSVGTMTSTAQQQELVYSDGNSYEYPDAPGIPVGGGLFRPATFEELDFPVPQQEIPHFQEANFTAPQQETGHGDGTAHEFAGMDTQMTWFPSADPVFPDAVVLAEGDWSFESPDPLPGSDIGGLTAQQEQRAAQIEQQNEHRAALIKQWEAEEEEAQRAAQTPPQMEDPVVLSMDPGSASPRQQSPCGSDATACHTASKPNDEQLPAAPEPTGQQENTRSNWLGRLGRGIFGR